MLRSHYWCICQMRQQLCTVYGAKYATVILFPRLVYVTNLCARVHVSNACLVIVIAFPPLVHLTTQRA